MIKNTHKAMTDYMESYRQAQDVHKQTVKYIKDNYKEGSNLYADAMKTAKETFQTALRPLKDMYRDIVNKDFEEVRKAIKDAVLVPPSADVLAFIPLIREGKMSENECQILLDNRKGNYMDSKLLHDAMGKHFETMESVMSSIDTAEALVNECFDTFTGQDYYNSSYHTMLVANGSIFEELDVLTDDFVNNYGVKETEELDVLTDDFLNDDSVQETEE